MANYEWIPLSKRKARKFPKLFELGPVFGIYRKGRIFWSYCQVPVGVDLSIESVTLLLAGPKREKKNLYISNDHREFDMLKERERTTRKKCSSGEYLKTLRPVVIDRLSIRGLEYIDLVRAGTDSVPRESRTILKTGLERIVDKYCLLRESTA